MYGMKHDVDALLGARSWYSLMDGALSPADLCARAAAGGWGALALTDTENLYALPDFADAAADAGIKPIAGARLELGGRGAQGEGCAGGPDGGPRGSIRAYCLDVRGYRRLCGILSRVLAWKVPRQRLGALRVRPPEPGEESDADADVPDNGWWAATSAAVATPAAARDTPEAGGGRASQSACPAARPDLLRDLAEGGWDGLALSSPDPAVLEALARAGAAHSGCGAARRLYAAIAPGRPQEAAVAAARRLGLPLLAEHPARFDGPGDRRRWVLLRAVAERSRLQDVGTGAAGAGTGPGPEADFMGARRAAALLSAFPEARAAARLLAEEAASADSFLSRRPVFPPFKGMAEPEAFDLLRGLCAEGALRRYGGLHSDVARRLEKELAIIRAKGFSSYFLVVRDIVLRCPRTCGRGSAASSIVSYLLGLTHVEPLAQDLFFERFLNEGRTDPPDIDIDFPWDERPALLASVFADFRGSAAMVADHCTFSVRGSVREAALALGMGADEVRNAGKALRLGTKADLSGPLSEAAGLLYGVPRYIGSHPGGVVITPGPITDYAHVQPSPAGIPVLAWEKDGTERAGLVKIDLLGNRSLAVLRDCIAQVGGGGRVGVLQVEGGRSRVEGGRSRVEGDARPRPDDGRRAETDGPRLEWGFDPFPGGAARMLLESGDTMGIFYVESPATRRLLRKMGTADYAHLVAASSIIRPAANRYIDEYVRRLRGSAWKPLPEAVERTLVETYGIMVYQEDVARVAMAAAGFSAPEADGLRKALTKKRSGALLQDFRDRFARGCAARGVGSADTEELWNMMKSFDGYSFCKAHSASYALVSYRLAWMKAMHPAVFMAAVINNGGGFYGTQAYVGEARRLGLAVLPPHVNLSDAGFRVEGGGRALRVGLRQVRDLSAALCARLVQGSAGGGAPGTEAPRTPRWPDLAGLLREARPTRTELRALVRSGCLDGLPAEEGGPPLTRPQALWFLHQCASASGQAGKTPSRRGAELVATFPEPPAFIREYGQAERLEDEARFLGLIVSTLPASLYRRRAEMVAARRALPPPVLPGALGRLRGARASLAGTLIAAKTVASSGGAPMAFVTLEGEDGVFDLVLFPDAYAQALPVLESHHAFLASGRVTEEFGVPSLRVERLEGLNRAPARHLPMAPDSRV